MTWGHKYERAREEREERREREEREERERREKREEKFPQAAHVLHSGVSCFMLKVIPPNM